MGVAREHAQLTPNRLAKVSPVLVDLQPTTEGYRAAVCKLEHDDACLHVLRKEGLNDLGHHERLADLLHPPALAHRRGAIDEQDEQLRGALGVVRDDLDRVYASPLKLATEVADLDVIFGERQLERVAIEPELKAESDLTVGTIHVGHA